MASRVYLRDLEVLLKLRSELSQFNNGANKVLGEVSREIKAANMLLQRRVNYWNAELRRRAAALRACESDDERNCSSEAASVEEARQALETLRKLSSNLERSVGEYQPSALRLTHLLNEKVSKAERELKRNVDKYRNYLRNSVPPRVISSTISASSPSRRGNNFENWARENLIGGKAKRITIHREDNPGLALFKNRRILDAYLREDGSLWEIKSGYEEGSVDIEQADDYIEMLGEELKGKHLIARQGGEKIRIPVKSVNYIFETKKGAQENYWGVSPATVWYVDDNGNLQLFDEK